MNIQPISQQNNLNFDGKVYALDLTKKQRKIVAQLRPFLNKQVENKNYNLYITPYWSDGMTVWAGHSKKYVSPKMAVTNEAFSNEVLVSSTKQAVAKYEALFGPQNVMKKKSFWERLFG